MADSDTVTAPQTPVMRQYMAAKQQHPEALLLFRLGDFYELFFDDAVTAARELQITLTARNKEKGQPVPMCGVPFHAAEGYIARLIQKGYKVALCDQMEPARPNVLVRREVTRLLTPGTAALQLNAGESRYLGAVARTAGKATPGSNTERVGLALLDLSTGEFRATEFTGADARARLADELERWRPRELLHAAGLPLWREAADVPDAAGAVLTPLDDWLLQPDYGRQTLEAHFGVLSLEAFGLADRPWAAAAAGGILHYVKETQRNAVAHVDRIGYFERQHGLVLDAVTVRNLELVEPVFAADGGEETTLRASLDLTQTAMGKRLLRQWLLRPSGERDEINQRLAAVSDLTDWARREGLRRALAPVQDLERLLARISLETALPRDLLGLAASLTCLRDLARLAAEAPSERLRALAARLDPLETLVGAVGATLVDDPPASLTDGGCIRPGRSAELDELRQLSSHAKSALAAMEARERAATGIASLKIRFNNIFGYYIEVSKANQGLVPDSYERKQTLVNAERFTTAELKEFERKILNAEEKSLVLEKTLFAELRGQAAAQAGPIRGNAAAVAELDLLSTFAVLAADRNWCRPQLLVEDEPQQLEIRQGRHPVVERLAWEGSADRFVANDLFLDAQSHRMALITGPNMGGKSTYLRQAALICILAHMGCFVPAAAARIPLLDRIFTRIGASDNLARGRSTFMVEMTEAAVILNQATPRSLVVLDEIGRGTATWDGLALAWAMLEHLHDHVGAKTLFATHFHELTTLEEHLAGLTNLHVSARESAQGIVFLRKVESGAASRSYGIEVARLAGLPRPVLERARGVLRSLERAGAATTSKLEAGSEPAPDQLMLFTPLSHKLVERLAAIDLDQLTPLGALNLLAELKRELEETGGTAGSGGAS